MSIRLSIPYKIISSLDGKSLEIHQPSRCSRCNAENALYFVTYPADFYGERIPHRQIGRKYRTHIHYRLRFPVCEDCYKADFLNTTDNFVKDNTPLGRIAKRFSTGLTIGALFAALGIVFTTGLIPNTAAISAIKGYWWIPAGIGVLIVAVVWFLQNQTQSKIRAELQEKHYDFSLSQRLETIKFNIDAKPKDDDIVLKLSLMNESWAKEFGQAYHLTIEQ